ncbi:MAG: sirohydrochlorin chelatase, partial [Microbacterium sp.]
RATAALLGARLGREVAIGYAAGTRPRIADAVRAARAGGAARVLAATYLLAPGHFSGIIADAGADRTTSPLAPERDVARVAVARYRHGCAELAAAGPSR